MTTLEIQTRLKELGFDPGPLDGVKGPKTNSAIIRFKESVGFAPRSLVGPKTIKALLRAQVLPWMKEINSVMGLHEERDNEALSEWLASDGKFLGDPDEFAWCGDAVETAIHRALPKELRVNNPYWARNWAQFGKQSARYYGAIVVFSRGSGGHVGFLVGQSEDGALLRVRGGNQSNMINDTWIDADRLLATRWPLTWTDADQRPAPTLDATGAFISRNEA